MSFNSIEINNDEKLFSTSPLVFIDIENCIDSLYLNDDNNIFYKLKYDLVCKDIIIFHLKKNIKKYELSHKMWNNFWDQLDSK